MLQSKIFDLIYFLSFIIEIRCKIKTHKRTQKYSRKMQTSLFKTKPNLSYLLLACEYSPPGETTIVDLLLLLLLLSSDFRPRSQDSLRKFGSPVSQLLIITILSKTFYFDTFGSVYSMKFTKYPLIVVLIRTQSL